MGGVLVELLLYPSNHWNSLRIASTYSNCLSNLSTTSQVYTMRFLYLLSVFGAVALASPILETRQVSLWHIVTLYAMDQRLINYLTGPS